MILSIIAAIARNGVIGRGNALPWHLPADLRHFKTVTMGRPVIMGRRTHESIGRPLPGRLNIVVSRNPDFRAEGCTVVASLADALQAASGAAEVFVVGGAQLYAEALPRADRLYLTRVEAEVEGDTWFPAFDAGAWRTVSSDMGAPDGKNPLPHRFEVLERAGPKTGM